VLRLFIALIVVLRHAGRANRSRPPVLTRRTA
jgi:hypothetical protein